MNRDRRGTVLASFGALSVLVLAMQRGAAGSAALVQPPVVRPQVPSVAALPGKVAAEGDRCHALVQAVQRNGTPGAEACDDAFESFLRDHGLCSSIEGAALVATLPDPLDSRLAESFDDGLAALVLAMERTGTLVDYWLPWAADRNAAQQTEAGLRLEYAGSPPGVVRARPYQSKCHANWPGVVVFRATNAQPGKNIESVLLIAGEGPTAGVDRTVLTRAVELVSRLRPKTAWPGWSAGGAGPAAPEERIRIVGPQFSGSSWSMRDALQPLAEKGRSFEIVSGSATARKNLQTLSGERMRFSATVIPDDVATAAFYRYLRESGAARLDESCVLQNVAILAEADTAYTRSFTSERARDKPECMDDGRIDYGKVHPRYSVLFPMHVALVRNVLDGHSSAKDGSASVVKLPTETVPLGPDDRVGVTRDAIPNFSADTAAYDDRALASALALFREGNVTVVGIHATDTRDKLFLAKAVHRSAPDVHLFVFESDSLLTHPDYADVMRGTLVVTTYPLIDVNKWWSGFPSQGESETRRQFAKNAAEGTYNATLVQLNGFEAERRAREGAVEELIPSPLVEYRFPMLAGVPRERIEDDGAPPLWITAVGGNAFWPVAVLAHDAGRAPAKAPPHPSFLTARIGGRSSGATPPAPIPPVSAILPPEPDRTDSYMHVEKGIGPGGPKLQLPPLGVLKGLSVLQILFCAFVVVYASLCILECAGARLATRTGVFFAHLAVLGERRPGPPAAATDELARRRVGRERCALKLALVCFATFFGMTLWLGIYSAAPRVFREHLAQALPGWSWASVEVDLFQPVREWGGAMAAAACAVAVLLLALRLRSVGLSVGRRGGLLTAALWTVLVFVFRWLMPAAVPSAFLTSGAENTSLQAAGRISGVFAHWRAIHPASFLSPITPMIAFTVILLLALAALLRLLALDATLEREPLLGWRPGLPAHALLNPTALCCGVVVGGPRSSGAEGGNRRAAIYGIALALATIPAGWALVTVRSSLDPGAVELAFRAFCAVAVVLCLLLMVHMFVLWAELRRWLSAVADSPLRDALAAARDRITAHVREGSRMRRPDEAALGLLRQQFAAATKVRGASVPAGTGGGGEGVIEDLGRALQAFALDPGHSHALRDFVGLRAGYQIAFAVFRLRSIWLRVAVAAICFVGAVASYPLYPHKELLVLCWALVAGMAGVTIWILVEMNRNEVLSTISGTDPNVVNWNLAFVEKLVVFGGLPVLSLLAAQFPEVARALLSVVEPVFRGIH